MAPSRKAMVGMAALGAALLGMKRFASKEQLEALMELAEGESGPRGVAIIAVMHFLIAVCALPATPVEVFSGYKFGMLGGFLVVVVGKQAGGICAYWLGRTVLRGWIRTHIVPKWKILQALDGAFQEEGLKMAFVFRSMFIPTSVKNYGCAALGCGFWQATCASMVFGPLYAAVNIYSGSTARTLRDVGAGGEVNYVKSAVSVFAGLLFVVGCVVALKEVRKQLAKVKIPEAAKAE